MLGRTAPEGSTGRINHVYRGKGVRGKMWPAGQNASAQHKMVGMGVMECARIGPEEGARVLQGHEGSIGQGEDSFLLAL